jgi:hypothetical protein
MLPGRVVHGAAAGPRPAVDFAAHRWRCAFLVIVRLLEELKEDRYAPIDRALSGVDNAKPWIQPWVPFFIRAEKERADPLEIGSGIGSPTRVRTSDLRINGPPKSGQVFCSINAIEVAPG